MWKAACTSEKNDDPGQKERDNFKEKTNTRNIYDLNQRDDRLAWKFSKIHYWTFLTF